jgi:hypothetical protein
LAINWMDDFTSYGTDGSRVARMSDAAYASVSWADLVADPDPTAGGAYVLQSTNTNFSSVRKVLPNARTTVGSLARYWMSALPSATKEATYVTFADVTGRPHVAVNVDPSGYFRVYRVDNAGAILIGSSTTPVVTANAWRHIETKVVIDVAAGSVVIKAEGFTVANITGVRTSTDVGGATASVQNVMLLGGSGNYNAITYVKDFIVWDNQTANNNDFMGTCQVLKLLPTGDTSLGWTPSSGTTGYNLINDTTPDDDTNYISAPFPAPSPSQFTLSDLPINVSSVRGVQLMHRSRKTDGGDGNITISAVSGANTGNGVDRPITTAYTYMWDIFDLDPSGTSWSRTLVNALQLKLNRTL